MADSPTLSTCGDTLVHPKLQNLQSQRVSRAGLVYGSSFSRGSCLGGTPRNRFNPESEDMWYDSERFQLDHINEVLTKLNEGNLDDEIWGKIVVMERCKRIAKAYLRKTTIIVDGGDEEFDGKTLGFNYFSNSMRDDYTKELKTKIDNGVIIKMDNQGNIKAMARGSTPIFVQGWKDSKSHCISEKVIKCHGKLATKSATSAVSDEDRVVKIFDMRRFKQSVERDSYESENDAKNLLLKTCVRIALVKDGGSADPMKTPCWFMIINLVALDMLKTKLPSVCTSPILNPNYSGTIESTRLSRIMSQVSLVPPQNDLYSNPAALTQLIAAAVHQANNHYAGTMANQLSATSMPALNVEHIAKLASTLSLANPNLFTVNQTTSQIQQQQPQQNPVSKRIRRMKSFSDSEESEMEIRNSQVRSTAYSESTTGSSSGISGVGRQKRFDSVINFKTQMTTSMDALHEKKVIENYSKNNVDKYGRTLRPRLSSDLFEKPKEQLTKNKNWKSCASTTSDYDSNREVFDSGSWSSRVSTNSQNEPRSYSPSIISEPEPLVSNESRRNSAPNEKITNLISEKNLDIDNSEVQKLSSLPEEFDLENEEKESNSQKIWSNHHNNHQQTCSNRTWFMSLRPTPSQRLQERPCVFPLKETDSLSRRRKSSCKINPTTTTNQTTTTTQTEKFHRFPTPPPKPESIQAKFQQLKQQELHRHRYFQNCSTQTQRERESSQSNISNTNTGIRPIQELQKSGSKDYLELNPVGNRLLRMSQPESEPVRGESASSRDSIFRTLLKQLGAATIQRKLSPTTPKQTHQPLLNQRSNPRYTVPEACKHGEQAVHCANRSNQSDHHRRQQMQLLQKRSRSSTHLSMAPSTKQELGNTSGDNPIYWNQTKTRMLHRTSSPRIESMEQWDRLYNDGYPGTIDHWGLNSPHRQRRKLTGEFGRVHGTNSWHQGVQKGRSNQPVLWAWDPPRSHHPVSGVYEIFTPNFNNENSKITVKKLLRY